MYWIHAVCKKKVHTYVVNIYLILKPNKTDGSTFTIKQIWNFAIWFWWFWLMNSCFIFELMDFDLTLFIGSRKLFYGKMQPTEEWVEREKLKILGLMKKTTIQMKNSDVSMQFCKTFKKSCQKLWRKFALSHKLI